eukprot:3572638-Pleurochrysis_carterae.AAC.2
MGYSEIIDISRAVDHMESLSTPLNARTIKNNAIVASVDSAATPPKTSSFRRLAIQLGPKSAEAAPGS